MTSLLGADVSHWQSATPTAGLSFLFAKATEGAGYADPMYATHIGRAVGHGLLPGAYHFARRSSDIDRQARWFVQHAAGARTLAVDVENLYDAHGNLIDPKMTRTQTRALITAVKLHDSLRRPVGLYMSESGFYTDVAADFRWIAQWDRTPVIDWDIHQYRGRPLDLDLARNLPTLNRIFRVPPPVVTPPTGNVVHIAHNARVRVYTLGRPASGNTWCIRSWEDQTWTRADSKAACSKPVHRVTCDGKSGATTVLVSSGAFKDRHIRVDPPGVWVS